MNLAGLCDMDRRVVNLLCKSLQSLSPQELKRLAQILDKLMLLGIVKVIFGAAHITPFRVGATSLIPYPSGRESQR